MSKSRFKKIAVTLLIAIPLIIYFAFSYRPISGTVVDAETGKPIEGAVVLVEWTRTTGIGLTATKSYKVAEVITDEEGHFRLPGVLNPFVNAPDLTIYKQGYVAWNNKYIFPGTRTRVDFNWRSGLIFRLDHFRKEYSHDAHTSFIRSSLKLSLSPNYETKKSFFQAVEWEEDLALQERTNKIKNTDKSR